MSQELDPNAYWIWTPCEDYTAYNLAMVARRTFTCSGRVREARLILTADSWYRLKINGEWVNDGPGRGWPEHYYYDELDVAGYLRAGENRIEVIARYYGIGDFHRRPVQAGLLAQLDVAFEDGAGLRLVSDRQWQTAEARAWRTDVLKVALQMEPLERYDARLEELRFVPAAELFTVGEAPWKELTPRDVALLDRQPCSAATFLGARLVRRPWRSASFHLARLLHPGVIENDGYLSLASAAATLIVSPRPQTVHLNIFPECEAQLTVNGQPGQAGAFELRAGENLLFVLFAAWGHFTKEQGIRFVETEGYSLRNPLAPDCANPWAFMPLPGNEYQENTIVKENFETPERDAFKARVMAGYERLLRSVTDVASLREQLGEVAVTGETAQGFPLEDPHQQFVCREDVGDGAAWVANPTALMHDNAEWTLVEPHPEHELELCYDLGEQRCGYYEFELLAEEGAELDLFGVEYIADDGRIQHTENNRNGLRYTCKAGLNRFVSLKRRSGRYLFLTLRGQHGPVRIRLVRVIESTYPANWQGRFSCSDPNLDRIWEIALRTLKLCMEDTFTDCPLYEQTLWVGDARNEGLYAMVACGAQDLIRRCITLAGQSLDHYPIISCTAPTSSNALLPAWSFLWGLSVWDYYHYSGDEAFLRRAWPWVEKNLRGAEGLLDERGLFSGPFWNMFDWTEIDDGHRLVLHNSLLLIGAIDAARKCAQVLGEQPAQEWLERWRAGLVGAINALWDESRQAYPDSIHADGTISPRSSVHTSFLALLFDAIEPRHEAAALRNILDPTRGLTGVGSPFAVQYLYEALEKHGRMDEILGSIRQNYLPMLRAGATTVWEQFANGTQPMGDFPTRSHCHAWSAAPLYFLSRISLGVRQSEVGGAAFEISPWLGDLSWARGAVASARGMLKVAWRKTDQTLTVTVWAPAGVRLRFVRNDSHTGLDVFFNGDAVAETGRVAGSTLFSPVAATEE